MERKNTFNHIIKDYDYARPLYPQRLYSDIEDYCKLNSKSKILEIGAGTGQASDHFVKKGYNVTLLEIGKEQVEFLQQKYFENKNVRIICSSFEDFQEEDNYDLVFSATAFHWIDALIGYPKAYRLLSIGGTMAVFWHMSSVTKHEGAVFEDIRRLYLKHAPSLNPGYTIEKLGEIHRKRIREFQSGGCFTTPSTHVYNWTDKYSSEKYIRLLNTYSSFQMLNEEKRHIIFKEINECINNNGGSIDMPQEVRMYLSKKENK